MATVAEILLARGEQQANQRRRQGEITGQMFRHLGDIALQAGQNYQRQQEQAPRLALEKMAVQDAQQHQAGQAVIDRAVQPYQPVGPQPEGEPPAPVQHPYLDDQGLADPQKISALLSANGMAHLAPDLLKGVEQQNDAILKHQKLQQEFAQQQAITLGTTANTTLKLMDAGLPFDQAVQHASSSLLATGLMKPEQLQGIIQQWGQLPDDQLRAQLGQVKATAARLGPTKSLGKDAKEVDMFGDTIASNVVPDKPPAPSRARFAEIMNDPHSTPEQKAAAKASLEALAPPVPVESAQSVDKLLDNKPATLMFDPKTKKYTDASGTVIENAATRIKPIPSASAIALNAGSLSDAAMDQAAQKYLETGQLPPGFGTAGVLQKTAIMNRAAKIDPKAALARNQAVYKADSANLTNLQKTEGSLSAFEKTAGKNLDQFMAVADKIPDTGVPWVNQPLRSVNASVLGSSDQAAFNAARDVALREIARVTNDPKLSGALTDSARREVLSLIPANATFAQIKRVVQVLKQDMANVHSGLTEQISAVKSGIGQNPTAATQEQKPSDPLGIR